jgi:hypothetical protein
VGVARHAPRDAIEHVELFEGKGFELFGIQFHAAPMV